jgi:hypothetical protein
VGIKLGDAFSHNLGQSLQIVARRKPRVVIVFGFRRGQMRDGYLNMRDAYPILDAAARYKQFSARPVNKGFPGPGEVRIKALGAGSRPMRSISPTWSATHYDAPAIDDLRGASTA